MERFLENFKNDLANKKNIDFFSVLKGYSKAVNEDYSDILKKYDKFKPIDIASDESEEKSKSSTQLESPATENAHINEIRTLRRELVKAWKSNDELRKELSELKSQFEIVSSQLEAEKRLKLDNQNRSLRSRFEALGIKFGPTDATTDEDKSKMMHDESSNK